MPSAPLGNFVWFDLLSPDPAGQHRVLHGGAELEDAAIRRRLHDVPELAGAAGRGHRRPPGWLYDLETDNLDAAVARPTARGGRVLNGSMPVPGGARVAPLADPHGVMFAPHESAHG